MRWATFSYQWDFISACGLLARTWCTCTLQGVFNEIIYMISRFFQSDNLYYLIGLTPILPELSYLKWLNVTKYTTPSITRTYYQYQIVQWVCYLIAVMDLTTFCAVNVRERCSLNVLWHNGNVVQSVWRCLVEMIRWEFWLSTLVT